MVASLASVSPAPIVSVNPSTGAVGSRFAPHGPKQVEERVAAAHAAFLEWRRRPVSERAALLARLAGILDEDRERLARMMTEEMGKLLTAARAEAEKCAAACRYYAEHAARHLAPEPVAIEHTEARVEYHPIGILLAVMPWNFPFWQAIRAAAPALAAGNAVLLKHASNVPRCAVEMESLFALAGFPTGLFATLLIESKRVADLLADDRIAGATLTGSEGAGSSVASIAGKHIKPTVMELGGSDAFIVMPSADLEAAAETAVRARTINNGQSCIAAKRFIVAEAIAEQFQSRFVERVRALRVGDPMDDRTEVGPLATPSIVDDLERQVRESVAAGARILCGGERLDRPGNWFQPTVLADAPPDSPAAMEELFGPVAALFRVHGIGEAIELANASRYGLGAAAFTRDRAEAERFAAELESGTVVINGMVASDPRLPFGGVKKSGYGRELGREGIRAFVNVKTIRISGLA